LRKGPSEQSRGLRGTHRVEQLGFYSKRFVIVACVCVSVIGVGCVCRTKRPSGLVRCERVVDCMVQPALTRRGHEGSRREGARVCAVRILCAHSSGRLSTPWTVRVVIEQRGTSSVVSVSQVTQAECAADGRQEVETFSTTRELTVSLLKKKTGAHHRGARIFHQGVLASGRAGAPTLRFLRCQGSR
jgi:hypothetical protein